MTWNHTLSDIIARGLIEMEIPASSTMPSFAAMQLRKIHFAFRLECDGLWHCFRYADEAQAIKRDAELAGLMMRPCGAHR